jgi:hypothetical protein
VKADKATRTRARTDGIENSRLECRVARVVALNEHSWGLGGQPGERGFLSDCVQTAGLLDGHRLIEPIFRRKGDCAELGQPNLVIVYIQRDGVVAVHDPGFDDEDSHLPAALGHFCRRVACKRTQVLVGATQQLRQ